MTHGWDILRDTQHIEIYQTTYSKDETYLKRCGRLRRGERWAMHIPEHDLSYQQIFP